MPLIPKESVLDLVVGGSLVPHVYCSKVFLDTDPAGDPNKTLVTLSLKMYEDRSKLLDSQWLQTFSIPGATTPSNLLDAMYIQVLPIIRKENFNALYASRMDTSPWPPENVYNIQKLIGDGALPRGAQQGHPLREPKAFGDGYGPGRRIF
jgi:hypothetical protein